MTLLMLSLSLSAFAGSRSEREAEALRLSEDITSLSARSAWTGVERKYQKLLDLRDVVIPARTHLQAALASRDVSDIASAIARLDRAASSAVDDDALLIEASDLLAELSFRYGEVKLEISVAYPGDPMVVPLGTLFDPAARAVVDRANTVLAQEREYADYLPLGQYRIGDTPFDILGSAPRRVFVRPPKETAAPASPDEASTSVRAESLIPDRIVHLAVRGGGWNADQWPSLSTEVRSAIDALDGVLLTDAFQPSQDWLVVTPDPQKLTELSLTAEQLTGIIGLQTQRGATWTGSVLAVSPGAIDRSALAALVVGDLPPAANTDEATEQTVADVASITAVQSGPYPVAPDAAPVAAHRIEVKVRGGSGALEQLLPTARTVPGADVLDLRLEEPPGR